MTKDARTARAVVRRLPDGKELCFFVGVELMESQIYRADGDQGLLQRAEDKRLEFLALDWSDDQG